MEKFNRTKNRYDWIDFFRSKGFRKSGSELEDNVISFFGCEPLIRIDLYSGYYRTDTNTGGCITAEFCGLEDRISTCPVFFCDDVAHAKFWQAIELLLEAGKKWSSKYGRIKEGNGYLYCDPPINTKQKSKCIRKQRKKYACRTT